MALDWSTLNTTSGIGFPPALRPNTPLCAIGSGTEEGDTQTGHNAFQGKEILRGVIVSHSQIRKVSICPRWQLWLAMLPQLRLGPRFPPFTGSGDRVDVLLLVHHYFPITTACQEVVMFALRQML